ncbi:GIN domain-containing protein [Mucilaginibacter panaciglaebae]|uniref:Putative auto-transporter adhesin head GIN domain-containing protein n=1 Tax=Mucilaginibacter panaciglaebae TaxID=502331 RepID=A0ABP7WXQ1_9SPHI
MKTSNKLLTAVAVLLIASVVLSDTALQAEYLKGDYKKPHYGMVSVPVKDFDAIQDYIADDIQLDVSQSEKFEVWIDKGTDKDLVFKVENRILKINFKNINNGNDHNYVVKIKCPRINSLSTATSPSAKTIYNWGTTTIGWFKQDSLRIISNAPGTVSVTGELKKLNILNYQGEVGVGGSKIDTANFNIQNESKLTIDDVRIGKINYNLSKKARVTLSGNSAKQLMH